MMSTNRKTKPLKPLTFHNKNNSLGRYLEKFKLMGYRVKKEKTHCIIYIGKVFNLSAKTTGCSIEFSQLYFVSNINNKDLGQIHQIWNKFNISTVLASYSFLEPDPVLMIRFVLPDCFGETFLKLLLRVLITDAAEQWRKNPADFKYLFHQ